MPDLEFCRPSYTICDKLDCNLPEPEFKNLSTLLFGLLTLFAFIDLNGTSVGIFLLVIKTLLLNFVRLFDYFDVFDKIDGAGFKLVGDLRLVGERLDILETLMGLLLNGLLFVLDLDFDFVEGYMLFIFVD